MVFSKLKKTSGYSLFELVVVVMIVGIIAAVSLKSMNKSFEVARVEETKSELDMLADAIVGDDEIISSGNRVDFGYVGDVGALPPNLAALVTNPGGYSTWQGPYINDKYYSSAGGGETEYAYDGWGTAYNYSGGLSIVSSGGLTPITRELASTNAVLYGNSLMFTVRDIDWSPPGTVFKDSVKLLLTTPDGTGGLTTIQKYPEANGFAQFENLSIGKKLLRVIYIPNNDTLRREIVVNPGSDKFTEITLNENLW